MTTITILDGGMGKELRRIGAPFAQPEWSALALLDEPLTVADAHRNFVEAGADIITTNSYSVVPFHLGAERFAERGYDLARLAAQLARRVADETERTVKVAGSLPPIFGSYRPQDFKARQAPAVWSALIEAQSPFVDFWIGETISSVEEFLTLREVMSTDLKDDGRQFWASFTLDDHPGAPQSQLRSAEPISVLGELVGDCNAVLFNCCQPEAITAALPELRSAVGADLRIGAYANAFPVEALHDRRYASNQVIIERRADMTAQRYGDIVARWIDAGATIVGGCCDMYPEHIAELARRFGSTIET